MQKVVGCSSIFAFHEPDKYPLKLIKVPFEMGQSLCCSVLDAGKDHLAVLGRPP